MFGSGRLTGGLLDRLTHHLHILESDVPSYRTDAAQQRGQKQGVNRQIYLTPTGKNA